MVRVESIENDACFFVLFTKSKFGGYFCFRWMTYAGNDSLLYAESGKRYASHHFLGVDGFEPMASDSIHLAMSGGALFGKLLSYRALSFGRGGDRDMDDNHWMLGG